MLTGFSSKDIAIQALRNRADDYIEKPIDIDKIKAAIERLLETKAGAGDLNVMDLAGKMEKVKRFIHRNCFKKIRLEEAAQTVSLSSKYLSRVFRQQTGMGFAEYRLRVKIEKAKELLAQSGCNIGQVSDRLGYENAESFIRQFKRFVRQTPAHFRRMLGARKPSAVQKSSRVKSRTRPRPAAKGKKR